MAVQKNSKRADAEPAADDTKKKGWKAASTIVRDKASQYTPEYADIEVAPQRIVAASAALQKRGKTTFGFTLPKPLAYMQFDANYEHALAKARKQYGKDAIRHLKYFADPRADLKAANGAAFDRFIKDFDYCCDNFRGVMVDTSSELMDVRKMAEFGRTTQIPQIYYGPIYSDFRWLVKRALESDANVLFIHRLKDEWMGGDRTGGYVMDGWRGVQFDAQMYIEHQRDDEGTFTTNIIECGQDAMLMGLSLSSTEDENDFATLATRVYPHTEREDWA